MNATCAIMTQPGMQPIDAFAQVVSAAQGGQCMDNSYADFLVQVGNTTVDKTAGGVGIRQWTWQTCAQFGYYQTCEDGTGERGVTCTGSWHHPWMTPRRCEMLAFVLVPRTAQRHLSIPHHQHRDVSTEAHGVNRLLLLLTCSVPLLQADDPRFLVPAVHGCVRRAAQPAAQRGRWVPIGILCIQEEQVLMPWRG